MWAGPMVPDVGKGEFSRLQQHWGDCPSVARWEDRHPTGCYEQKNWSELGKMNGG